MYPEAPLRKDIRSGASGYNPPKRSFGVQKRQISQRRNLPFFHKTLIINKLHNPKSATINQKPKSHRVKSLHQISANERNSNPKPTNGRVIEHHSKHSCGGNCKI
jgi:hypothetical protein